MAEKTLIEWADTTLNLWIGCTQISPACDHCYAMRLAPRFKIEWNGTPKRCADSAYAKIATYQRGAARFAAAHGHPRRVFINSLSDFLDNQAEQSWRDKACIEMERAPDVIFIIVTKRPQNAWKMFPAHWLKREGWPPNVWLIVTAENQQQYDLRVGHLLSIPGPAVAGVSVEPMLERIYHGKSVSLSAHERAVWASRTTKKVVDPDTVNRISWVIVGGESGRGARPMPSVEQICDFLRPFYGIEAAVFVKQMSQADHPDTFKDPATFPPGLRTRQHPVTTGA